MKFPFFKLTASLLLTSLLPLPLYADNANYIQQAKSMAAALGDGDCPLLNSRKDDLGYKPKVHELTYKYDGSNEETKATLVQILCWRGAYSESDVFVLFNSLDAGRLLSFATPDYEVKHENNDSEAAVKSIKVTGFSSRHNVVFADFDSKTLILNEFNKHRGLGDAFSAATWHFENGKFSLKKFVIDASYDGKQEPQTIVNYK